MALLMPSAAQARIESIFENTVDAQLDEYWATYNDADGDWCFVFKVLRGGTGEKQMAVQWTNTESEKLLPLFFLDDRDIELGYLESIVVMPDGRIVLFWREKNFAYQYFAQRYERDGTPIGDLISIPREVAIHPFVLYGSVENDTTIRLHSHEQIIVDGEKTLRYVTNYFNVNTGAVSLPEYSVATPAFYEERGQLLGYVPDGGGWAVLEGEVVVFYNANQQPIGERSVYDFIDIPNRWIFNGRLLYNESLELYEMFWPKKGTNLQGEPGAWIEVARLDHAGNQVGLHHRMGEAFGPSRDFTYNRGFDFLHRYEDDGTYGLRWYHDGINKTVSQRFDSNFDALGPFHWGGDTYGPPYGSSYSLRGPISGASYRALVYYNKIEVLYPGYCGNEIQCGPQREPCEVAYCDGDACTAVLANDFSSCDDAYFCTTGDYCEFHRCRRGSVDTCGDLYCDESNNMCVDVREVQVNPLDDAQTLEGHPRVAMNGDGQTVIVWQSEERDNDYWELDVSTVYARIYDTDGAALSDPIVVADSAGADRSPVVGVDGLGRFAVAWVRHWALGWWDSSDVFLQFYDANGRRDGRAKKLTKTKVGEAHGAVIDVNPLGLGYVAWWEIESTATDNFRARLRGRTVNLWTSYYGPVATILDYAGNRSFASGLNVAVDALGNAQVVWAEQTGLDTAARRRLMTRRIGADGYVDGPAWVLVDETTDDLSMADLDLAADGSGVATWAVRFDAYVRRFGADGNFIGDRVYVGRTDHNEGYLTTIPRVSVAPDGKFVITRNESSSKTHLVNEYAADGTPIAVDIQATSWLGDFFPQASIAFNGEDYALVWESEPHETRPGDENEILARFFTFGTQGQ
ncbi:MAG: hypothetical protein H6684_14865 [Deltaproteobacteria bacterium]|nr:hypothetical protein [Deltaproteobacteria bacterium]MCB9490012.1 hypothetical protein [Deltaproteobacteria bacterium]